MPKKRKLMVGTQRKTESISLIPEETQKLADWANEVKHKDLTAFEKASVISRRLGAHYRKDGLTEIGFWVPALGADQLQSKNIFLEVLTPQENINPVKPQQNIKFYRQYLPINHQGEYLWGVYEGIQAGTKEKFGSFYWLLYLDINTNKVTFLGDAFAYSLPYGVYAPAEVYDLHQLHENRTDLNYFKKELEKMKVEAPKVQPPRNILQLHIGTASPNTYVSGLTQFYRQLATKVKNSEPLTPTEENFIGYDAVQLMPVEPNAEYKGYHDMGQGFFIFEDKDLEKMNLKTETIEVADGEIEVILRKPDTHNWGYDIVIFGSAAIEPAILETLRPDELVEFIATLHNFPGKPIQVIYDVVYGHADNQALDLLNECYFKSPGMYGQEIEHQNPTVRAILLEMQRRKMNTGADALRIDGGQDFQFFNPLSGKIEYDDEYLKAMADIPQNIQEYQRYPFPIFEDGRPWPNPGWEEISTYRDVLEYLPDTVQWGPLVFAHNKPTVKNFWDKKWRRVKEVMAMGSHWITGCGNHDTMHRGSWVDPAGEVNRYLGETLPEIFRKGYDNPAIGMWVYGFSPGIPMDFINCIMRAPWTFFRNTDKRYGIKIIAKEKGFIDWQIDSEMYNRSDAFLRLKEKGFEDVQQLSKFITVLAEAVEDTNYDLQEIAHRCRSYLQGNESSNGEVLNHGDNVAWLEDFGIAYMEDMRDISSIWKHTKRLDSQQTAYSRALREFRLQREWLRDDLLEGDLFDHLSEAERTLFYGIRTQPSKSARTKLPQQVAMVAHMGGAPITLNLEEFLDIRASEWQISVISPGLEVDDLQSLNLHDSQGVLLERICDL
jgi:hypothetical protein